MRNIIDKMQIRGFKSFLDAEVELRPLNVLIGANSVGKSNFISLFSLIVAAVERRLPEYLAITGGIDSVCHYGQKTTPSPRVSFSVNGTNGPCDGGKEVNQSEHYHVLRIPPDPIWPDVLRSTAENGALELHDLLTRLRVYHFHDTSTFAKIRGEIYIHDNGRLLSDGANLAAFLYYLRERQERYYRAVVETVQQVFPHFGDFDIMPLRINEDNVRLNWREKGHELLFGPRQLSDGLLRFIALTALLLQPPDELPPLIVIDEPELGLHPYAIQVLASLMQKASEHCQIITATQSVTLVDQFEPEDIVVVERKQGISSLKRLDIAALADWLEDYSLSELWEKNVLGGRPSR